MGLANIEDNSDDVDTQYIRQRMINMMTNDSEVTKKIFKEAYIKTDILIKQSNFDINYSGTTAVTVLLIDGKITCANTGDSRAVLGYVDGFKNESSKDFPTSSNKIWRVRPLSHDHKPYDKREYERILKSNGRVLPMRGRDGEFVGPHRVWLKNENIPGLAMSRSLGDKIASQAGVIPDPEITERILNHNDKFVIIASDGIWQYISNEEAADIVVPFCRLRTC